MSWKSVRWQPSCWMLIDGQAEMKTRVDLYALLLTCSKKIDNVASIGGQGKPTFRNSAGLLFIQYYWLQSLCSLFKRTKKLFVSYLHVAYDCYSREITQHQTLVSNNLILTIKPTYLLTPWFRVLLEKLTGLQLVKKFPAFQEPEGSLPHSQTSATCLYPGPVQSSPYTHIPPPSDPS